MTTSKPTVYWPLYRSGLIFVKTGISHFVVKNQKVQVQTYGYARITKVKA